MNDSRPRWLIYGAYGYTGTLVTRLAVEAGLRPVLAGRNAEEVRGLAERFGLEARVFSLHDAEGLRAGIEDMSAVLQCAGPLQAAPQVLIDACLDTRVHLLDIAGEVPVLEGFADRDADARAAGVMLLPGVGFSTVPFDLLAARLVDQLPSATRLDLVFGLNHRMSRGTAVNTLQGLDGRAWVRRGGQLAQVPIASDSRRTDFATPSKGVVVSWGAVQTAHWTTQIPDIGVYLAADLPVRLALRTTRWVAPLLLRAGWVHRALIGRARRGPAGPDDDERASTGAWIWGVASNAQAESASAGVRTPDAYTTSARVAVQLAARAASGDAAAGLQTSVTAYGAEQVDQMVQSAPLASERDQGSLPDTGSTLDS